MRREGSLQGSRGGGRGRGRCRAAEDDAEGGGRGRCRAAEEAEREGMRGRNRVALELPAEGEALQEARVCGCPPLEGPGARGPRRLLPELPPHEAPVEVAAGGGSSAAQLIISRVASAIAASLQHDEAASRSAVRGIR